MRVVLDVVEGPRKGRQFVFDSHDTFIVGRSRYVHCSMPEDSALSRDHFLIEVAPPRCELRDLGSTNGTFVNDEKVERARLESGDRILAGQSTFLVRVEPGEDDDQPPAQARRPLAESLTPRGVPISCAGCGQATDLVPFNGSVAGWDSLRRQASRPLGQPGAASAAGPAGRREGRDDGWPPVRAVRGILAASGSTARVMEC